MDRNDADADGGGNSGSGFRPVPKPRKSVLSASIASEHQPPTPSAPPMDVDVSVDTNEGACGGQPITPPPQAYGEKCSPIGEEFNNGMGGHLNDSQMSLPPPYSAAVPHSDSFPAGIPPAYMPRAYPDSTLPKKVCSNDDDPNWEFVTQEEAPTPSTNIIPSTCSGGFSNYSVVPRNDRIEHGVDAAAATNPPPPIGWNLQALDHRTNINPHHEAAVDPASSSKKQPPPRPPPPSVAPLRPPPPSQIYPQVSVPQSPEPTAGFCDVSLILRFGKQGASVRDFAKPVGLAVSKDGSYIISDNGGEQSRIFIYNSGGELTAAFKTGYKVEDIAMTRNDEIFAAVQSNSCAFRHFTMGGQLKSEQGKFFSYESPRGVAVLSTGGAVLTGTLNNCVYVLTDQMKLATKFGRKGNGDGYFTSPAHVAVDSKNHIIVTDRINNCVQVFYADGKFKLRFTTTKTGELRGPMGVCVDDKNNIIVADSGNCKVEVFSKRGQWLSSVVRNTEELGEQVRPVNVAVTPTGKVAVLLRGPYFCEVRVYSSHHQMIPQDESGIVSNLAALPSSIWYSH